MAKPPYYFEVIEILLFMSLFSHAFLIPTDAQLKKLLNMYHENRQLRSLYHNFK